MIKPGLKTAMQTRIVIYCAILIEADEGSLHVWHATAPRWPAVKAEHLRTHARTYTRTHVHARSNAEQGVGEIGRGRGPQSPGSSCLGDGFETRTPKIISHPVCPHQYLHVKPSVGPLTLCVSSYV